MGRILGIDYGSNRVGLAATDPLQIIVNSIATIETKAIKDWIVNYCELESVEIFVIGLTHHRDGSDMEITRKVHEFAQELNRLFPNIPVVFQEERNTSVQAKEILLQSGIGKMKRKEKARIDQISAVLILQKYLGHI